MFLSTVKNRVDIKLIEAKFLFSEIFESNGNHLYYTTAEEKKNKYNNILS